MIRPKALKTASARNTVPGGQPAWASAYEHSLSVLCSSAEQFDRMRQQIGYGFKGLHRTLRAAREIEDQSLTAYTTHTAAQGGKWSLLDALIPHAFGYAGYQSIADGHGGLGRYVAHTETSAAGGHDASHFPGQPDQQILNLD